jgi:acyl dehydratase
MPLYLDDITPGMSFETGAYTMEESRMKAFAAEFDPQYFHLDDEAAKTSMFGGLAASGWHTAAATMRLIVQSLDMAGGIVGSGGEISWLKPVRAGDVLRVRSEVIEVVPSKSKPDRGAVTLRSETRNQHDEVVQVFTSRTVLRRRPA